MDNITLCAALPYLSLATSWAQDSESNSYTGLTEQRCSDNGRVGCHAADSVR
jgi:hypothetical protein